MNYRHSFHAGNFADAFKHCLLVGLIRGMQRKEKGFLFLDTHAGRGAYDLSAASSGDTHPRAPEWPGGIGRLARAAGAPPLVEAYAALVRGFDRGRGNSAEAPRHYPGSPRIAALLARPQDRLELWEKHPEECAALGAEMAGAKRTAVHEADGYGALRACLPPAERRALVLIDPPFESQDEWDNIRGALGEGLDRFPSGAYAVWHPVTDRAGTGEIVNFLEERAVPSLHAELVVDRASAMRGCGVFVVNPPWQFDAEAGACASYLAGALQRDGSAQGSVRWIVAE